jgi:peptidoglycan hydrolase-like protein with peptidoglycan-binding domain
MSLSIGSSGQQVAALQQVLNVLPSNLPRLQVDGKYGSLTAARVREFQTQHGFGSLANGVFDDNTAAALEATLSSMGGGTFWDWIKNATYQGGLINLKNTGDPAKSTPDPKEGFLDMLARTTGLTKGQLTLVAVGLVVFIAMPRD